MYGVNVTGFEGSVGLACIHMWKWNGNGNKVV